MNAGLFWLPIVAIVEPSANSFDRAVRPTILEVELCQSVSKRLEGAHRRSKIERVLIFRPKGHLEVDLLVGGGKVSQLHVELVAIGATAAEVGCEGTSFLVVLRKLGGRDVDAVDGLHDILGIFFLGEDRLDVLFQAVLVDHITGAASFASASTLDKNGLFRL